MKLVRLLARFGRAPAPSYIGIATLIPLSFLLGAWFQYWTGPDRYVHWTPTTAPPAIVEITPTDPRQRIDIWCDKGGLHVLAPAGASLQNIRCP